MNIKTITLASGLAAIVASTGCAGQATMNRNARAFSNYANRAYYGYNYDNYGNYDDIAYTASENAAYSRGYAEGQKTATRNALNKNTKTTNNNRNTTNRANRSTRDTSRDSLTGYTYDGDWGVGRMETVS